jgi:Tol biopolymer transport system component
LVVIPDLAASQQTDLYTYSPSGDSVHRVTDTPTWEAAPSWSADGRFIAYQVLPPSGLLAQAEIHLMKADGTGDRKLAGPGPLGPPAWSPDGARLAFDQAPFPDSGQRALLVIRATGSDLDTVLNRRATDAAGAWSPDGASLAFTSNCLANSPACWATTLWTVRLADTALRQLTFPDPLDSLGQDDAGAPRWSPDGDLLAIQHGALSTVALLPAAGGSLIPVNTGTLEAWSPAWSPTGSALAFVAGPPSGPAVWLAASDGSNPRPLISIPGILRTVHWRP